MGALLRREGLYSSHLATWRAARERGDLVGLRKKRGPAPRVTDSRDKVIAESKGEADRFTKIYQAYKQAPEVTRKRMFLETMERVLADSDKVIVDQKAGNGVVPYLPLSEFSKKPAAAEGQP